MEKQDLNRLNGFVVDTKRTFQRNITIPVEQRIVWCVNGRPIDGKFGITIKSEENDDVRLLQQWKVQRDKGT